MSEVHFQIAWPDHSEDLCYSPSLVIKKYFEADTEYDLADFVERSRTALNIASDRVKVAYGYPCKLALGQLQEIETKAVQFAKLDQPKVKFIKFNN